MHSLLDVVHKTCVCVCVRERERDEFTHKVEHSMRREESMAGA